MNFQELHLVDTGMPVAVNLDAIDSFTLVPGDAIKTLVSLRSGNWVVVTEAPSEIWALLNPMRAFSGKRDVGEAAEQDTRTKLLISAYEALLGSAKTLDLRASIAKEVGEAALEQAGLR